MRRILLILMLVSAVVACREDDDVVQPDVTDVGGQLSTEIAGMYVLCEGNMGSNKATLDYLDLAQGKYNKNIFPSRNPQQVMQLGDVGNDAKVYGGRLYLVVNCSNKVEVCTADSARSLGHVDIPNCRYVCFDGGYAYVSSYVGGVPAIGSADVSSVPGCVYKIDTLTLKVAGRCTVGYQPDELCVVGRKLYVANSGGYQPFAGMDYDSTVSQIDLETFREERRIEVAPNLFRLRSDKYGQLWATGRGIDDDEQLLPSRLYLLRPDSNGQMQLADSIDRVVSDLDIVGDTLFCCGTQAVGNRMTRYYGAVDVRSCSVLTDNLLSDDGSWTIQTPYGIKVHPQTRDIYVMDATNYVSSGYLLCFSSDGSFKWKTQTGDIPGHACWLTKTVRKD